MILEEDYETVNGMKINDTKTDFAERLKDK